MSAATTTARPREQWTSQSGFILAAIGSAVGLGNIWRFPGVAYENGGGAFMIPYLVALLTAGIPILFLDYALGHRFRGAPPLVFHRLTRRAEPLGWFQVALCAIIPLYYAAVLAWAGSYFVFSFDLAWGADAGAFFAEHVGVVDAAGTATPVTVSADVVPGVLLPLLLVWVVAVALIASGLVRGIERANVVAIPLLGVAFGALVVRALFLEGSGDGLDALFTPNWAALGDPAVWVAAYGQVFFSLSVAFGIMITYSSYRARRSNMTTSGLVVAFANSSFEVIAGIGVFATLGFMAHEQGVGVADLEGLTGTSLSFVTFPTVIAQMPGGEVFGAVFFGSLVLAGFTSLLSILQVVSGALQDKLALTPRAAALGVGGVLGVVSIALFSTTTGLYALDVVDNWANNIGIVGSAVAMTVLVMWVLRRGPELSFHLTAVSTFPAGRTWLLLVGVVAPVVLGYMLVSAVLALVRDGYGDYPTWYVLTFGWGTIALAVVLGFVLAAVRWRADPDVLEPWPVRVREDARREDVRRDGKEER